jgi:peptide/nickel transport system substrate-binding protein
MYRVIPDQTTLLAELLTGGVDVYVQMLPNHAETARSEPNLRVVSFPYPSIFFIAWNSRVPKLSDPRVRRALTLGMNRRQLIEGVQGGEAVLLNTGLPPVHWAFDPTLGDSLSYDPEGARALLAEAGWVDRDGDGIRENEAGEPLQIQVIYNQNQEREQVGEILRVQLREVGVDLRPTVLEMGAYRSVLTSQERDFEGAFVTFETGFRIDDRDLFHSEVVEGPWAFSGTRDPELDRYLDTLQLIPDREEALILWRAYQLRLMELQPYTFLYSAYRRNGLNQRLKGVVMDTRGDWATLRDWWISPQDRRNR